MFTLHLTTLSSWRPHVYIHPHTRSPSHSTMTSSSYLGPVTNIRPGRKVGDPMEGPWPSGSPVPSRWSNPVQVGFWVWPGGPASATQHAQSTVPLGPALPCPTANYCPEIQWLAGNESSSGPPVLRQPRSSVDSVKTSSHSTWAGLWLRLDKCNNLVTQLGNV